MTASLDQTIKLWGPEAEAYGTINLTSLGRKDWKFPFDWVKLKLCDINEVFHLLELIGEEQFDSSLYSKEEINKLKDEVRKDFLI